MIKFLTILTFLLSSFYANASIVLNNGESFSSSFELQDDGEAFKITDFYWEALAEVSRISDAPGELTMTFFNNSNQFVTPINNPINNPITEVLAGGFSPIFSRSGSFTLTNTGTSQLEIFLVTIADFSGAIQPSNIAIDTITPSAVPLPAAGWLMLSTIGMLGMFRDKKKKLSLSAL